MEKGDILKEITKKKEFSRLPEKDVELVFSKFERRQTSDEEKIKLTRELLHKVYSSFTSLKLLSPKDKTAEWILRKHLSTRERLPYYEKIYSRILDNFKGKVSIIDLGAGVNGFSYNYLKKANNRADYFAIEGVGQLVDLTNDFFMKEKIRLSQVRSDSSKSQIKAKAIQMSLFDLDELKEIISETDKSKIAFLFKIIDSLEMLEKNYSFKLINGIAPFVDLIVISFAVESMIKRKKFHANRKWIIDFIQNNFKITDDFQYGGERYICFANK